MKLSFRKYRRAWLGGATAVLVLLAAVTLLPRMFRTQAVVGEMQGTGFAHVTRSHNPDLENYDIRIDKTAAADASRESYRQQAGKGESDLIGDRQQTLNAISDLERRVPALQVDFSGDLNAPEVVATDVLKQDAVLARASGAKNEEMVRSFIQQNKALYGLTTEQVNQLRKFADYTNPAGNLSFVEFAQEINGIQVFRGEIRAIISRDGHLGRTISNLAPNMDYNALQRVPGSAADAVAAAAKYINRQTTSADLVVQETLNDGKTVTFDRGQFADQTTAELIYFPLESGVMTLAWRVSLWEPVASYYVIVDANDGKLLWRKNTTEDQTQSATYKIYADDSPTASSPVPITTTPTTGHQGAVIGRTSVTLIGNEGPLSFNNLGWITDGNNTTDGNNIEAGIDRDGSDGVDPAGKATGSPNRVFDFTYNPAPGNPGPDEDPIPATYPPVSQYQQGVVTNLFYWSNRYHDVLYQVGFTELARNFQNDNFGRGGVAADRVRGEAQDSSGTNNANFSTQADGVRGRMQMYIFTQSPGTRRDGDLDGDVFIHELTHGTSNRLIGNASGLTNNEPRGMGEGWSDFYARALLSTSSEDLGGIYPAGAYVTINVFGIGTTNYYYGIRRFPYALKTTLGGPLMRPHNPLTFADIDSAQANITDGAFAASPPFAGNSATEVHNAGEVWCMALLEVRARIINRLGFAAGNTRILQLVTDGMKGSPLNPSFIQARNAIIDADTMGFGGADLSDIWGGFATRGMGFGATSNGANVVVQSFALPNIILGTVTFSDATTGNNNGFADPGETLVLTVPLQNPLSTAITGVTAMIAGNTQNYGTIAGSTTVNRTFNYTVPPATPCGSTLTVPVDINGSEGAVASSFDLFIGQVNFGYSENFDALSAPAIPAGWTTAVTGSGVAWVTSTTTPDTAPNAIFTTDPSTTSSSEIVTTDIPVTASSALEFRLNYNTELGWDGSVLEISIAGGAYQDILTAGGTFTQNGYPRALNSSANPLSTRQAWTGNSGGYVTVKATFPAAAIGQNVKLKFRAGSDASVSGVGTRVDGIRVVTGFTCVAPPTSTRKPVADFDNDGKTDLSVFRSGNWYIQRSTAGFLGVAFGLSSDVIAPGDYDGDGKADVAVFRSGAWYVLKSSDGTVQSASWGLSGDLPVASKYDGDSKTDFAVYRPSNNTFYILRSSDGMVTAQTWGTSGDIAMASDFDGDGKSDFAVFRPSTGAWYLLQTTAGAASQTFGTMGDRPVPADYDGDGKCDVAVFRPSAGAWYLNRSTAGLASFSWGASGDVPVPGDYDGDGKDDVAVFRSGAWYVLNSGGGSTSASFGLSGDVAVPAGYIP